MDISTKLLFKKSGILRAFHSERATLTLHSDNDVNCLSAFQPPTEPSSPDDLPEIYPTNRALDGHLLSTNLHLNLKGNILFASLRDDRRLAVTTVAGLSVCPVETVRYLDLQFNNPLFSLENLGTRGINTIVAVSSQGELALVQCDKDLVLQTRPCEKLDLQRVLATSVFGNQHLIVFGIQSDHFVFIALRIAAATDISKVHVTSFNPVLLPIPDSVRSSLFSKSSKQVSLSACFYTNCIYTIWSNGTVNVLAPDEPSFGRSAVKERDTIDLWCTLLSNKTRKPNPPVCIQSFNIAPDAPGHHLPVFAVRAGTNFVAICRGTIVSIWDVIYHLPHGYIQLDQPVRDIYMDSHRILLSSDDTILDLLIPEAMSSRPPTLATAIRRKASCDSVINGLRAVTDNEPLRAHALTTTPISTAAHAGGQSPHLFSRALDAERDRELRDVKAVLSRPDTPTAASLQKLGSDYFQSVKDDSSSLEVPRLPSDRLAAAFVARCLYEIASVKDYNYVFPLIDMIGTGVVSAEGVLVALEMSNSWATNGEEALGPISSVSSLFPQIAKFTNVFEALVARVVDLPELDLINVLHMTAWFRKDIRRQIGATDVSKTETRALKLDYARVEQLLRTCLRVRTGQNAIVQALSKIPFSDALLVLNELNEFMRHRATEIDEDVRNELNARAGVAEQRAKTGENMTPEDAVNYRGYKRWVDTGLGIEKEVCGNGAFKGCVEWIGYILDAHLPSIILDPEGAVLASQLLETVQKEREQRECLQGLKGMTVQIQSQFESTARGGNTMYRVVTRNIPIAHSVV